MSNVIKGYSIQNGEPTPDNPVEIESLDIEEDIKILEKFKNNEIERDKLERNNRYGGWKIGDIYKHLELNIAIENILAERKQDKETIKKLKLIIEIKDKLNRLDLHKENTTLVLEKVLKTLSRKDIRDD